MLTRPNAICACFVILLCASAPAFASFDIRNVIAVPMENGDEGTVELRYVTYLLSYTSKWPGVEVMYTCSPAPVAVDRADKAGSSTLKTEEANIAHQVGLTIQVEKRMDERTWNSPHSVPPGARWGDQPEWPKDAYVDTLKVQLSTEAAYKHMQTAGGEPQLKVLDAIVRTTIDCVRDNASRSAVPIRHVQLKITGPPRYRKLGGIMRITPRPNRGALHSY